MWKGIHSSFKPEQAHCHHRGEKPLIGPNLCQLWLQFDHNVSIEKARDGAHCIGPTQRPIRKTFLLGHKLDQCAPSCVFLIETGATIDTSWGQLMVSPHGGDDMLAEV